jgi:peptidylprolyl isomerase
MIRLLLAAMLIFAAPLRAETMADVLARAQPSDWRTVDPDDLLVMETPSGQVLIELARHGSPLLRANIRQLARDGWFAGISINRVQDNYVVQWGDASEKKPLGSARATIAEPFAAPLKSMPFVPIRDADGYAPRAGFIDGFPAAADPRSGKAWLVHCYASLGVGRGATLDSGNGAELYAVIGHAPRHLDLNVAVVGRVLVGIEKLSSLPRGTGPLGFYEQESQRVPVTVKLASLLPPAGQPRLERLRTDTSLFQQLVAVRRNRKDDWFQAPANHVDVCNIPLPVRSAESK